MHRSLELRYIKFYKPYEVLCQFSASQNRLTLQDFIPVPEIYPAGRLDYRSEGMLLLTNDPATIHRLTSPKFHHPKTYLVQVEGEISDQARRSLQKVDLLPGVQTKPAAVEIIPQANLPPRPRPVRDYHPTSWLRITLCEGKKHQIRRMTAAVGFPTLRLVRVSIAGLTLGDLQPGEWCDLSAEEIARLDSQLRMPVSIK